ncbi:MAG: YaiI/YqxD family protein [Hyphomicrobiales bacterium]|nr:YaiI/YqxD family protein [Hyphomicrobiales bacterium]
MNHPLHIFVDADACPVKDEIYKVAYRMKVSVTIVANNYFRVPRDELVTQVVVGDGMDAADDYIAEHCSKDCVVITADILLADRCLKADATVISPTGKPFTDNSIGSAVATRAIMADLRVGGEQIGGAPPFSKADRSRFLSALDAALVRLQRRD